MTLKSVTCLNGLRQYYDGIILCENGGVILFMLVMVGCSSWIRSFSMISFSQIGRIIVMVEELILIVSVSISVSVIVIVVPLLNFFIFITKTKTITIYPT